MGETNSTKLSKVEFPVFIFFFKNFFGLASALILLLATLPNIAPNPTHFPVFIASCPKLTPPPTIIRIIIGENIVIGINRTY